MEIVKSWQADRVVWSILYFGASERRWWHFDTGSASEIESQIIPGGIVGRVYRTLNKIENSSIMYILNLTQTRLELLIKIQQLIQFSHRKFNVRNSKYYFKIFTFRYMYNICKYKMSTCVKYIYETFIEHETISNGYWGRKIWRWLHFFSYIDVYFIGSFFHVHIFCRGI